MRVVDRVGLSVEMRVDDRDAVYDMAVIEEADIRIIECEYGDGQGNYDSFGALRHDAFDHSAPKVQLFLLNAQKNCLNLANLRIR